MPDEGKTGKTENAEITKTAEKIEITENVEISEAGGKTEITEAPGKKEPAGKQPKTKKAPGFYKKSLTEKQLQKKYLKFIEQPDDKAFVRSCYAADSAGGLLLRQDLIARDVKRLKTLKKAVKQNRKFAVKIIPLTLAAALVAGIVIFFTVFANPLLQRALETGLEAVFEARVNAERFRISVLKFEISMDGLTIADRDAPMTNLIQFSRMRIKLRPQAVLRGKVYIEEIRADNIRFGTARAVSGALPGTAAKEKRRREGGGIPPLVDLQNFDAAALINQEYGKLQTPKLYDSAINAYTSAAARWKGEEEAARARIAQLRSQAEPFLRINVNDYRTLNAETIEQIRTLIRDANTLIQTVQAAQNDVNRMVDGAQTDINTARTLEQNARGAVTADFNHLRSYLDLGSGAAMEVLEPVVRGLLTDTAETYVGYGERALEVLEKVKAIQAKLPKSDKPEGPEQFRGRDVAFPSRQYPGFYMGVLATDVLTPSGWHWSFDLRGVSSDPDLSGTPTTLALSLSEDGDGLSRSGAFRGQADFRSGAAERFNAEVSGSGFPVDVSISQAGIGGFKGGAAFALNVAGDTDGSFTTSGDISLVEARLSDPQNTFAQAAGDAIRQVPSVDLGIRYGHEVSGADNFSLTTNFGDILKNTLTNIAARYRERAEQELERILRERIEQHIDGRFVSREELDTIFGAVRGDKNAMDALRNTLEEKKTELENRIRSAAEEAVNEAAEKAEEAINEAADSAREQGEQAIQDILQGKTPSVPSLPNFSNPFRR